MEDFPLLRAAQQAGHRTAVIDSDGPHTYEALVETSMHLAAAVSSACRERSGERVALLAPPGFDYVAGQWAIWLSGGIVVPLGLMHPPAEMQYVLEDADVTLIVVAPEFTERADELVTGRSIDVITTRTSAGAAALPPFDEHRPAQILYTSGSTGRPKGVVTTHANVLAQTDALVEAWQWQPTDHILNVLPLHHIHGIVNALCCAVRVGAVCEFSRFEAERVWDRFRDGNLTLFMAVPTIYSRLIRAYEEAPATRREEWSRGARSLRLMVSGSAALPVPILTRWEDITGQRLLERYGMTEIGMALSNPLNGPRQAGYVGTPLPGVSLRRTDEHGAEVTDETPGEIEVKGPAVFLEYYGREAATRDAFHAGWFRTGDIATVRDGAWRILGRSSVDIIKTGGYKVSALEIEDVLRSHPAIVDCAVVGVDDEEWGQRVALCAVMTSADNCPTLEEFRTWCRSALAPYKIPSLLQVTPALPRNAMGKVQKHEVARLFGS